MSVVIRVPGIIDVSGLIVEVGETTAFVTKFTLFQTELARFSNELSVMAGDLQSLSDLYSQAAELSQSASADLEQVRALVDSGLEPAIAAAIGRIDEARPVVESDLHARALYF